MTDEIDVTAADWRPNAVTSRAAVVAAVEVVAAAHGGEVHISDVRPMLPAHTNPHQIGAMFCALRRGGYLVPTGEYRDNGGTRSRNGAKPARVYRLTRPIPMEVPA